MTMASALPEERSTPARQKPTGWRVRLLALIGIEPTDDVHEAYDFLRLLELDGRRVALARWPSSRYHVYWPHWLRRPVTLLFNHLALLVQIVRGCMAGRVVLVREYTNWLFLPLGVLLWPLRRRMILNINDNLEPGRGRISEIAFDLLRRMGYRFLLLEATALRERLVRELGPVHLLTPPFAVTDRREGRVYEGDPAKPLVVGFVGYFRPDKGGVDALTKAIRGLLDVEGVHVALGYWNRGQAEMLPADVRDRISLHDTFDYRAYQVFLRLCDAVIVLATPAYELRHSGVVVDTLSRGTLVLCPDYPLLAAQVQEPAVVGAVYDTLQDLPQLVERLKPERARLQANFDAYFAGRSAARVNAELQRQWDALG